MTAPVDRQERLEEALEVLREVRECLGSLSRVTLSQANQLMDSRTRWNESAGPIGEGFYVDRVLRRVAAVLNEPWSAS